MPLEIAIRPRIRLDADPAKRRRARLRLPRFALPVAAYWLTAAGVTYALMHLKQVDHWLSAATHRHEAPSKPLLAARRPAPPSVRAAAISPAAETARIPAHPVNQAPEVDAPTQNSAADEEPAVGALRIDPAAQAQAREQTPARREEPAPPSTEERNPSALPDALAALPALTGGEPRPAPEAPVRTTNPAPFEPRAPEAAPAPRLGGALVSCEAAAAAWSQEIDLGRRDRTADLSREALAAVLDDGAWLRGCAIPERMTIDVCVAIREGAVTGATVTSRPIDTSVNACVKRHAAALRFPHGSRLDIARTRFEPR